uniref:Uncharacterized protein n=1 Tax=Panagrolaimus sp. JU765 TaxID=591449 RepID=A0AC34QJQ9_9BILA
MFDSFEYYLKQVTESKLKYIEYLKRHGVEEGKMLPREVVKLLHDRPVMCRLTAFSIQMAPLLNSWHAIFENPITFIAPFQFYVLLSMRNGMKNDDIKAFYQYMKFRGYHILKHPRPPNCFRYPFPMSSLGHNFYVTNDLLFWEFFEGFRGRWEACRKVIANADPHEFQLVWCKTITKARNSISELDNELREMFEKEGYGNKNNNENVDEKVDGNGNAE